MKNKTRGGRYLRITQPLIRQGDSLQPATWDEALNLVAERFRSNRSKFGDRSFGIFSCSKSTNEMNYLAQKFIRQVMGSNNIDSCNRT